MATYYVNDDWSLSKKKKEEEKKGKGNTYVVQDDWSLKQIDQGTTKKKNLLDNIVDSAINTSKNIISLPSNVIKAGVKTGNSIVENAPKAIVELDAFKRKPTSEKIETGLKTVGNTATNMAHGAGKSLENFYDFSLNASSNVNTGLAETLGIQSKQQAQQERQKVANIIKRDLTTEAENKLGWTDELRKEWEKNSLIKRGNIGGQVAQGIGEMIPTLVVGNAMGGIPSNATKVQKLISTIPTTETLGISSYGGALEEAYNEGATTSQANKYALGSMLTEVATEWLTGGVPGVNNAGILDNLEEKTLNKVSNNMAKFLIKEGYNVVGEGTEEALAEIIKPYLKNATYTQGEKVNWNDVIQSAIVGGITGGVLDAPGNIAEYNTTQAKTPAQQVIQQQEQKKAQLLSQQKQQTSPIQAKTSLDNINMPTIQNVAENSLKQAINNYQYIKSENTKIDNLRKDASTYWNNSEKTQNFVKTLEKIVEDKGVEIRLDPNLTDETGRAANGKYQNGVITINPNSSRAGEFVAMHELTHAIGTDSMRSIVENYRKSNSEFNKAVTELLGKNYNTTELTEEAMADVAGQLFGNQEFINNLSMKQPNIFKRIYNEIKYLWHQFTGYKSSNQFIDDLKNKWESAYRSNKKLNGSKNYYIENIASFDENEYNNIKQEKLANNEFANLATIINSDTEITPGKNILENIYDYNTKRYKDYEIYYKENGQFKVVKSKFSDGDENARYSKTDDFGNETTGSRQTNDKLGNRVVENKTTNTTDVRLPSVNKGETYTQRESNRYDRQNSRELENSSFSYDNKGRKLSDYALEKTKNSKVRESDGTLMLMYHGSPDGTYNQLKEGTYFTPNKEYAQRYTNEGASSISTGKKTNNPKVYEAYLNIENPFDINDSEARNIYINDYIKGGNALGIDPYQSNYDNIKNIDWTEVEDLKEFLKENYPQYDGIVADEGGDGGYGQDVISRGKSYIPFSEEQIIKANDNNTKYSKENAEWNNFLDKNFKDTGTTGTLMAMHSLSENNLLNILDLDGLPVPSLGITDANSSSVLDEFGGKNGVVLLFSKDTINPKNKSNEVYSRDIYSKTVPEIYQKVDKKNYNKVMSEFRPYESEYGTFDRDYSYNSSLDKVVNDLMYSSAAKAKFLEDNGYNFEKAYKKYKSSYGFTEDVINKFIKEYPELASFNPSSIEYTYEIDEIAPKIKDIALDMMAESNPNFTRKQLDELFKAEWRLNDVTSFYRDINDYRKLNGQKEFDIYETRDNIDKVVDEHKEEYENWLRNKFADVYGEKYFEDSSGRKKSYTLENLTSYMKKGKTTAQQKGLFDSYSIGQAKGDAAQRFSSIEDIKKASNKLVDVESYKERHNAFENIDENVRIDIGDTRISNGEDVFEVYSDYYKALGQTARGVDAEKALKNNNFNNLSDKQIQEFKEVANDLSNLPAKYFEAKPQRTVGLDEIAALVIPNTAKESTRQAIRNKGLDYVEYDPNVEGDRQRVINKFDNLKFSKESKEWKEFVNKHFESKGTTTKLGDLKLPTKQKTTLPSKTTTETKKASSEVKMPIKKEVETKVEEPKVISKLSAEESKELKTLKEIDDAFGLESEEEARKQFLEKKQQGYIERFPGLKKVKDFKEISRDYGKYKDLSNFDNKLLKEAEGIVPSYRDTGRRTKEQWLEVAKYIGNNFKGNSSEALTKYAIQSWFETQPNQKGTLNRQGSKYVDFKIQDWINEIYDGARIGELEKPLVPTQQVVQPKKEATSIPMVKNNDVLKVESKNIAKQINETGGFNLKQRSWAETSTESDVLKGKVLIEDLDPGKLNYVVQSNKKSLDTANRHINTYGYEKSLADVKSMLRSDGLPKASDVALMQRMIQEATKRGDYATAQDLIMDTAILGTDLGQATQALSMIKRLTPEGQLTMYTKLVERAKARGEKSFQNVEITPEMVQNILEAYNKDGTYDQNDLNARVEKFKQDIADQMKTTVGEKVDAWRYLAMLGNPKTHIRNMVSNVAMTETIKVKNAMARTLETILPIKERTKTWKPASKDVKEFSKQTANNMKDIITGEAKYNEKNAIESKKQIFNNKVLEKLSNFNSNALEAEDWFFSKRAFQSTLQEYLTAKGINTKEDIQNHSEIVEKAKVYAVEQAEIATFRQYSKLASTINQIERKNKAASLAVKALVPFKKTPINVAKAGVNYSPLGFIKALSYDTYQLKQGNINASQFIDKLSQGFTGTSLTLIGYALAKAGFITGGGDDDKEGKYDSQLGTTGYSLKIGGKSYSISWLSPVAMPLLVGANAYEQLEEDKEWDMNVVSDSLAKTLDPLNEMSFMQGVTNALNSYSSGVDKWKGIGESTLQNYIGQFFPTIFSQLAATTDDKKRSTKASNNSTYKFGEQTIRSIMYKIPGLRQQLEVATDVWGNEKEQSSNIIERAFESFIAPYSKTKDISTDLDKEIKRVYNETGEKGVIPSIPYAYTKYDGETYKMSAKEYTEYKKTYGKTASTILNSLISSSDYKQASDEEKAKMIDNVYDYARAKANQEYFDSNDIDYENETLNKLDSLKDMFGISASTYYANKKEYDYAYQYPEKYMTIKQIAPYDKYNTYKDEITNIRDNTTNDKEETIKYINSLKMSVSQKAMFIKQYYKNFKQYDKEIIEYINSQKLSLDEKTKILTQLGFTVKDGRVY